MFCAAEYDELGAEAISQALKDAGIAYKDVEVRIREFRAWTTLFFPRS